MLFRTYGQAILTRHERHPRILIVAILAPLPTVWRQTVSSDNGTEFTRHHELHALGIETFFCDNYSPWQKGGVENAIGRMRRSLPRKTDLAYLPEERFTQTLQA